MYSLSGTSEFIFQKDRTFTCISKSVDGFNVSNCYAGEAFNGKTNFSNWQIQLTTRSRGAIVTFDSNSEAIKGGLKLHLYRGTIEELHHFKLK